MASIKPRPELLDYDIWDVLQNKTNTTSRPNIREVKIYYWGGKK